LEVEDEMQIVKVALEWLADAQRAGDDETATVARIAAGLVRGGKTPYGRFNKKQAQQCVRRWEANFQACREEV